MNIIVTGANGLLGQHLIVELVKRNYGVLAIGRGESRNSSFVGKYIDMDITDSVGLRELIVTNKPDVIIHAAAMTQVDECEHDKQSCYNINVAATRFIIDAAREINCRIMYISTDFVFDGQSGPYDENSEPSPVNYYGSTKVTAEKAVMESNLHWTIIRTVLVYGQTLEGTRSNLVSWVKESLEEGKTIKLVGDQWRTPTFVGDLVKGIILALEKPADGIFHIAGKENLTPFDMGIQTARHLHLNSKLIEKVDTKSFPQAGVRPLKTGFKIDKARTELGYEPMSFGESLDFMYDKGEKARTYDLL